jgi:hypothetical protein
MRKNLFDKLIKLLTNEFYKVVNFFVEKLTRFKLEYMEKIKYY